MRFNKAYNPKDFRSSPATAIEEVNRSLVWGGRQIAAIFLVLTLAACSVNSLGSFNPFKSDNEEDESQRGTIGFVKGFIGGVAADEPRAVLIGRDILSAGGTAADAAVAMSFALAVTLPSSASLGGGGVCVVRDAGTRVTETLDFLPRIPKTIPATAVRPTAIPGNVRGLAALHAKYGKLRWAQLVSPAENLARFGTQVSRAFASDFKRMPPAMLAEPEIRNIFFKNQGSRPIREGDFLKQLDLSVILGRLRARGAGDFYNGPLARQLVAAVTKGRGSLTLADLRSYVPRWRPTLKVPYIKNTEIHVPMISGPSSVLVAQMMGMLIENGDWEDSSPAERAHLMAEVTGRAFAHRGRWLQKDGNSAVDTRRLVSKDSIQQLIAGFRPDRHLVQGNVNLPPAEKPGNPAGTGFVVVDRKGSAVACALSLNNLFGAGWVAEGTGIVLAALPGPMGRGPDSLAVMMLVGKVHNVFYYGAAASGGSVAPSALVAVTANTLMGRIEENLEKALAAKRVHNGGVPDLTYYEQGLDAAIIDNLTKRGHRLSPAPAIGLVNAIFCSTGIPVKEDASCSMRNDPRGFGFASGAE